MLDSDRALTYVLLHGDDPASGWNSSWLSTEQAEQLLAFLKQVLPSVTAYDLVSDLQRRLGDRPSH